MLALVSRMWTTLLYPWLVKKMTALAAMNRTRTVVPLAGVILTTLVLCSEQDKDYRTSGRYNADHTSSAEQDKDCCTSDRYNSDHIDYSKQDKLYCTSSK